MEINYNDPITKKNIYADKKSRNEKIRAKESLNEKKDETLNLLKSTKEIKELQATVQKSILKSQAVIVGLENIKNIAESTDDPDEKNRILKDIIDITMSDNKQVLNEYKTQLIQAIEYDDYAIIEDLISRENEQIKNFTSKEQNILSIGSSLQVDNPEVLLQSVIRQIKAQGEPQINLAINKVLDLLEQ